jgi:lysophospholipase L1-like esterase
MLFEKSQKIVFIGDAITDCDRHTSSKPYGWGYVSMIRNLLIARYPELDLTFVNNGVNANTVRDLAKRWDQDVIAEKPNWLSVMIGINDVWRHFAGNVHEAVPLDEFQSTLRSLLKRAKEATIAKLILMTPYVIEADRTKPMRQLMDVYGSTMIAMTSDFDALVVNTQAAFDAVLQHTKPRDWADDQIHPIAPGHGVLALAFLRAIKFEL